MPGRTMRDFPGGRTCGTRYLVLGLGTGQAARLAVPRDRDEPVAYGPAVVRPQRHLAGDGGVGPGAGPGHGTHHPDPGPVRRPRVPDWQFGGRS